MPTRTQKSVRKQVTVPSGAPRSTKPRADPDDGEEAATRPGAPSRQSAPLSTAMFGGRSFDSEEDPATVKADRRAISRALAEVDSDPATVQRPRTPMSFLGGRASGGESVMDPETVFDNGGDWRDDIDPQPQDPHAELPPGPLPSAVSGAGWSAAWSERSGPTLSREVPSVIRGALARHVEEPHESRVTVWIPILAGAAGGMLLLVLVTAWLAGSP